MKSDGLTPGRLYALALIDEMKRRSGEYNNVDKASTVVEADLGLAPFRDPDFRTHFDRDTMAGQYSGPELDKKLEELAGELGMTREELERDATQLLRKAVRTPLERTAPPEYDMRNALGVTFIGPDGNRHDALFPTGRHLENFHRLLNQHGHDSKELRDFAMAYAYTIDGQNVADFDRFFKPEDHDLHAPAMRKWEHAMEGLREGRKPSCGVEWIDRFQDAEWGVLSTVREKPLLEAEDEVAPAPSSSPPLVQDHGDDYVLSELTWKERVARATAVLDGFIEMDALKEHLRELASTVQHRRMVLKAALRTKGSDQAELADTATLAELNLIAKRAGIEIEPMNQHLLMTGNPGVGKTEAAIALGKAYHLLGITSSPHVECLTAKDLIEEHVGGTRKKAAKMFAEARAHGGTVFVDEIHGLAYDDRFGPEAIQELLGFLSSTKKEGDAAVIGAGYANEINALMRKDSGLEDRFGVILNLPNYSSRALLTIIAGRCGPEAPRPILSPGAEAKIAKLLDQIPRGPRFANARAALNCLELWTRRAAHRVLETAGEAEIDDRTLRTVTEDDVYLPAKYASPRPNGPDTVPAIMKELTQIVLGQDDHLLPMAESAFDAQTSRMRRHRAVGVHLLMGPSGCGKSEAGKALAKVSYNGARFQLSAGTLISKEAVKAAFSGADAGYVGHEGGSPLAKAIRANPSLVVQLDEIEKGDLTALFNFLMDVWDQGYFVDNNGDIVDCTGVQWVLTSNLGLKEGIYNDIADGLYADRKKVEEDAEDLLKSRMRPEWLNRFDSIAVFDPLPVKVLRNIARQKVNSIVGGEVAAWDRKLAFDGDLLDWLLSRETIHPEYGTRPLERLIQREIKRPLLTILNTDDGKPSAAQRFPVGSTIEVVPKEAIGFRIKDDAPRIASLLGLLEQAGVDTKTLSDPRLAIRFDETIAADRGQFFGRGVDLTGSIALKPGFHDVLLAGTLAHEGVHAKSFFEETLPNADKVDRETFIRASIRDEAEGYTEQAFVTLRLYAETDDEGRAAITDDPLAYGLLRFMLEEKKKGSEEDLRGRLFDRIELAIDDGTIHTGFGTYSDLYGSQWDQSRSALNRS